MSLKIENSRRDDESRPVCVGLNSSVQTNWRRTEECSVLNISRKFYL